MSTELEVEISIRNIIREIIGAKKYFTLFDSKDVTDIIICRNIVIPKIFFIEVKHYTEKIGRIGFGDTSGKGFQPEVLKKQPKYLEENFIWVFTREKDNKYYVSHSSECIKYVSGGLKENNSNNFSKKIFNHIKSYDKKEFVTFLEEWLLH